MEHIPVLADCLLSNVIINPEGCYLDGTFGLGGHSALIADKLSTKGKVVGLEWDERMYAKTEASFLEKPIERYNESYAQFDFLLASQGYGKLNGALLDIGISSVHADDPNMGFTYRQNVELDFRFNQKSPLKAKDILNTYSAKELMIIFSKYGEERFSKSIAQHIVKARQNAKFETTFDLNQLLEKILPKTKGYPKKGIIRIAQALRIETNKELDNLTTYLDKIPYWIAPGGWIAIISFHSLEDKIVKKRFQSLTQGCICPPDIPECRCNRKAQFRWVGKKNYRADQEEVQNNKRASSAILRIIEKI